MLKKKIRESSWYSNTVAICIGVVLFVILWRFPDIWAGISTFVGFFKPLIIGCVIAYIVNPFTNFLAKVFKGIKNEKTRRVISNALAFIIVFLFLGFAIVLLVPQLIESVETFVENLNEYVVSFSAMLESWGLSRNIFGLESLIDSSENLIKTVSDYIIDNIDSILSASASAGKGLIQWVLGLILSIYLIGEKSRLKAGVKRLLKAVTREDRYQSICEILNKCDSIFNRYIVFSLIDAMIVGTVNAIFMAAFGMEYIGLISFIIAVANLIPDFGPIIGTVLAAFIILMVNPMHALIFIICCLLLQTCDTYIIKPYLFGNSLGISGLWILTGVVVGGNMFGMIGILFAIPCVAVLDFIYETYIITSLESRDKKLDDNQKCPGDRPGK